jgi:hypothetical protein
VVAVPSLKLETRTVAMPDGSRSELTVGPLGTSRTRVTTWVGDSSLDFVLRFWIRDPQKGLTNVRGQVLLALWDAFKANGVAIPYPHREVIMKQVGPPPARLPGDV